MTATDPAGTPSNPAPSAQPAVPPAGRWRWRVVDIVVAAVLGVAAGVVFWGWDAVSSPLRGLLKLAVPGGAGLVGGIWLLGGTLGALIIRRPGAAIFVELIAALVSALIGNQWGLTVLVSGLLQGLGAELVFLVFGYKRWGWVVAMLAGALAAAFEWVYEIFVYYPGYGATFQGLYLVFLAISGAVLAGLLGWLIVRALAKTGVLDRFASGREVRTLV